MTDFEGICERVFIACILLLRLRDAVDPTHSLNVKGYRADAFAMGVRDGSRRTCSSGRPSI